MLTVATCPCCNKHHEDLPLEYKSNGFIATQCPTTGRVMFVVGQNTLSAIVIICAFISLLFGLSLAFMLCCYYF